MEWDGTVESWITKTALSRGRSSFWWWRHTGQHLDQTKKSRLHSRGLLRSYSLDFTTFFVVVIHSIRAAIFLFFFFVVVCRCNSFDPSCLNSLGTLNRQEGGLYKKFVMWTLTGFSCWSFTGEQVLQLLNFCKSAVHALISLFSLRWWKDGYYTVFRYC